MRSYLKLLSLLLIPLVSVVIYAKTDAEIGVGEFVLEKATLPCDDDNDDYNDNDNYNDDFEPLTISTDTLTYNQPDTATQRILFFGDSMLESLGRRFDQYTTENGHELTSVIWYSSSTKLWATTDTLQHFIRTVKPSFVMICLGSNELSVRDLTKRDAYVKTILQRIGDLPYCWVSPPNWKEDSGINKVILDNVGKDHYFDSRHLVLERGSDNVHPTFSSGACWMDTVVMWMNSGAFPHPIRLNVPTEKRKRQFRQIILAPIRKS